MDGSPVENRPRGKQRGPHVEKRLKAAWVKVAPPGRHTDGGGLYLDVDPSGARRWLFRITVRGKRRDFRLGSAHVLSLADARDKALELRRVAALGGDPGTILRGSEGERITFADLARQVHRRKFAEGGSNGKHVAQWISTLEIYAFPVIGRMSVAEITQREIQQIIDPIWTAKPETARRVLQRMTVIFDHARALEYRTKDNPAAVFRRVLEKQKRRPEHFEALDYGSAPRLMDILKGSDSIGAAALAFTILTASRSHPVRHATWEHFSSSLNEWVVPAALMKTREEFRVPLSMPAVALLKRLQAKRRRESDLVFPSPSNPKKPISENTMRQLLQTHFPTATVHGMRATFRTWAAEAAAARYEVAEAALAHAVGSQVSQRYQRSDFYEERNMLMERWALWLERDELFARPAEEVEKVIRGRWREPPDDLEDGAPGLN